MSGCWTANLKAADGARATPRAGWRFSVIWTSNHCAGTSKSEGAITKDAQAAVKLMCAKSEQVTGPEENMRPRERNTKVTSERATSRAGWSCSVTFPSNHCAGASESEVTFTNAAQAAVKLM